MYLKLCFPHLWIDINKEDKTCFSKKLIFHCKNVSVRKSTSGEKEMKMISMKMWILKILTSFCLWISSFWNHFLHEKHIDHFQAFQPIPPNLELQMLLHLQLVDLRILDSGLLDPIDFLISYKKIRKNKNHRNDLFRTTINIQINHNNHNNEV